MFEIASAARFEDVGEPDESGQLDYAYRGCNYVVSDGEYVFQARTYDDEPRSVTVVAPTNALFLPQIRELVAFLSTQFDARRLLFYSHERGHYVPINADSLEFELPPRE